jgi:hypothetical protein
MNFSLSTIILASFNGETTMLKPHMIDTLNGNQIVSVTLVFPYNDRLWQNAWAYM